MAGLLAGGLVIYGILAAITLGLAVVSVCWIEYRSHAKRKRMQKLINSMR